MCKKINYLESVQDRYSNAIPKYFWAIVLNIYIYSYYLKKLFILKYFIKMVYIWLIIKIKKNKKLKWKIKENKNNNIKETCS